MPLPFFTVFNIGDPPTKNVPKMQNKPYFFLLLKNIIFPNGGRGGVPHLGKIPTFSRFFSANVPNNDFQ